MNRVRRHVAAMPLLTMSPWVRGEPQPLLVAIPSDVYADYLRFLEGRDPLAITDFAGRGTRRDVVEVILLEQALRLGGLNRRLVFQRVDSYARILREVESGRVALAANSVWLADVQPAADAFFISAPVLPEGSLQAVLYTSSRNIKARSARTLAEIKALRFVSNQSWTADWATLSQMKLPYLQSTSTWSSMVNMVAHGRADVLLAPLQATPDRTLKVGDEVLVVIPKLKVKLLGSRHFVVSRHHADSAMINGALQKGLHALTKRGQLAAAYQAAGLFQPMLRDWVSVNQLAVGAP